MSRISYRSYFSFCLFRVLEDVQAEGYQFELWRSYMIVISFDSHIIKHDMQM